MNRNKSFKLIPPELNSDSRIEKKQIELLCDTTQKLVQICNKKELKVSDLKWQPHYSTVFKQLKSQLELILATDSSKSLDYLNNIPYLLQLKNNMINLFNTFAKFVQDNGPLIGTKDDHMRKTFFTKVVHFQFLYFEIQAYFPNGIYSPHNVKISKSPARMWWEKKFNDNIFVDLETFVSKFKEDYPFINQAEIFSFKNSINFTSTNFTTTFEFDLFTRLYSPWERILEVWRVIYSHPAYLHFSTYGDTKDTLSKYINEPGTYVFRISCKDLGFWTIGYVKISKEMGQVKVDKSNLIEALVEGNKKNMYLYPNGESCNPDLSSLNDFRKEIIVNNDDLQLYECFDAFKECKICRESEKDLQLESCGHQICQNCYKLLRKYDKKNCPFCNQKILSTTKIVNVKDPSRDIDAMKAAESIYMDMSEPPKPNVDIRSHSDLNLRLNSDSVYSNISDDVAIEILPSVPPRIINDQTWNSKRDKKLVLKYPAVISKNQDQYERVDKCNNIASGSSPIYSEMSLNESCKSNKVDSNSLLNDTYCVINEPTTDPNPSYLMRNQNNPNIFDSRNGNNVKTSLLNESTFNSICISDDCYSCPNDSVSYESQDNTIADDVYLIPNSSVNTNPSKSEKFDMDDDVYCNPNDDIEYEIPGDSCSALKTEMLSLWDKNDVERAIRVARNDESLAKDILMEFVSQKTK